MDERTRVLSVLRGQKPDMVPWLGGSRLLDGSACSAANLMPEQYQGNGLYQYHRDLGVGFYLQGYFPFRKSSTGSRSSTKRCRPAARPRGRRRPTARSARSRSGWLIRSAGLYVEQLHEDLEGPRRRSGTCTEHTFYEPDYELAASGVTI